MKFTELKIQNFLAITEAEVNLADRGLVLIQGVNEDDTSTSSNGAGKSSVADALCWCWYGTTARDVSGDDVVNETAGKDCFVQSVLIDGTNAYTATRHRKHKSGKNTFTLTVNDGFKTTDLTKGTDKLTQEVALKIIGSSHEVFVGSIYAGQEKMPDLPSLTDKQLKLIVEEASGVTILEEAYREARNRQALATATLQMDEQQLLTLNSQLTIFESQVARIKTLQLEWTDNQAKKIADQQAQIVKDDAEIAALDGIIAGFDAADLINKMKECDDQLASHTTKTGKLNSLTSLVTTVEYDIKALGDRAKTKLAEHKANQEHLANVKHQVGCPCSACGRPITENEIDAASKAAEIKVNETAADLDKIKHENEDYKVKLAAARKDRDDFAATVENFDDVIARKDELLRRQSDLNQAIFGKNALVDRRNADKAALDAMIAEVNPHLASAAPIEAQIASTKAAIETQERRVSALQASLEIDAQVVSVYSPSGVRAHVMDEITPFLNAQTAKYLSVLSDGNMVATWTTLTKNSRGEMKEKFSIDVTNATGAKIYKGLSGGEKRKVRLATTLALQDLVSTRANKPIELFIGDEIDDALDAAGIERLMILLEEKATERGSVFVISHNELKDFVRQSLIVTKKDGKSTISEIVS